VGLLHDVTPRSGNGSSTRCHFSPSVVVGGGGGGGGGRSGGDST